MGVRWPSPEKESALPAESDNTQIKSDLRRLILISVSVVLFQCLLFVSSLNPAALLLWSCLLATSESFSNLLRQRFAWANSEKNYVAISALYGLLAGLAPLWILPVLSVQQLFLIPLGTLFLSATAAMLLSSHNKCAVAFITGSWLPLAVFSWSIYPDIDPGWIVGWITAFFAITLVSWSHNRSIKRQTEPESTEPCNKSKPVELGSDLLEAIHAGQLEVFYQPKLNLRHNAINKAEALVRWQHPDKGLIRPPAFIPVAEQNGLIHPLGQWVLTQACQQAVLWQESGTPIQVAVNVSAIQLQHGNLAQQVSDILTQTGLDAHYLELELTESTLIEDQEENIRTLEALRSLGISISIDDFGTGYSSLSYLKRLPVDGLKIDKSFINDLAHHNDCPITRAVIGMAHELGLTVVAEGVSNSEILPILRRFNCDEAQGNYIARPLPAREFMAFLNSRKSRSKQSDRSELALS